MLFMLMYLIGGIICIFCVAFIHLVKAEYNGYKAAEWWSKNNPSIDWSDLYTRIVIIVNILAWPIRIVELIFIDVPEFYEQYERK